MRFFFILILSLGCLTFSCNPRGKSIDKDNIIDRETMVKLMADMQITETALRQKQSSLNRDTMKIISEKAFDSLYLYYKTTPAAFQNSLKYYQQDLEKYLKMNEEMITFLTQKEDSIKLENDSLVNDTVKGDTTKIILKR